MLACYDVVFHKLHPSHLRSEPNYCIYLTPYACGSAEILKYPWIPHRSETRRCVVVYLYVVVTFIVEPEEVMWNKVYCSSKEAERVSRADYIRAGAKTLARYGVDNRLKAPEITGAPRLAVGTSGACLNNRIYLWVRTFV